MPPPAARTLPPAPRVANNPNLRGLPAQQRTRSPGISPPPAYSPRRAGPAHRLPQPMGAAPLPAPAAPPAHGANRRMEANVCKTFLWATAGLGVTVGAAAAGATLLPPVSMLGAIGLGLSIPASAVALFYPTAPTAVRTAGWLGLHGLTGLSLSALALLPTPLLLAAGGATVVTTALLTGIVWAMPINSFATWHSPILGALCGVAAASLLPMLLPQALMIDSIITCVALAAHGASTLMNVSDLRRQAGRPNFSPMQHAVGIYINTVNLFLNVMRLMAQGGLLGRR